MNTLAPLPALQARALLIFAEPSFARARLGRRLRELASTLDAVEVRDLYELYPDFFIDAELERELLDGTTLLVFVFQLRSYCLPALLVEWIDAVLCGRRLPAARCWVILGCPGAEQDYRPGMAHGRPPGDYILCIEQNAAACGMEWIAPHVFYHADEADAAGIDAHAAKLERMIAQALGAVHGQ